jgi:ribosomal-protein-alanine N-acetyltransferase
MIELRKLEWGDVDGVHSLLSRMDVVQHMLFSVYSREESEKFVRDSLVESPSEQCWKSIVRAVSDSGTGTLVGLGGLVIMRGAEEGEIWYLVDPDSWGKGVATETATRLLNLGFGELGLHRIWASSLPENPASGRVLEKAGMRNEGFLVGNLKIHGVWKSSFLYAILAEERRPVNPNTP